MIMKYPYILFLVILFCCCNNKQISNNDIDASSDFYFKIYSGGNDEYNSKTGLLTRCYLNGFKTYDIVLSDDEKESIYKLYKAINFQSFPPRFEVIWSDTAVITMISPSFETSLEMCENGTCKKVTLDFIDLRNPINDRPKALEYKKIYDNIWKIIKDKEEYKNIPNSDVVYL